MVRQTDRYTDRQVRQTDRLADTQTGETHGVAGRVAAARQEVEEQGCHHGL